MAHILIIDDSATLRASLSFILTEADHEVDEAENGAQGLERYQEKNDYHLIITDINMPEMNGLEFLENLRKMNREIPVLVLTTESDKDKIEQAKALKANAWIIKPFQQDDLLAVVSKLAG
ncbi:MAG: response regulator [Spirochaetes bacterium]|nr:response regulator [Spirochaetota bacterium]